MDHVSWCCFGQAKLTHPAKKNATGTSVTLSHTQACAVANYFSKTVLFWNCSAQVVVLRLRSVVENYCGFLIVKA